MKHPAAARRILVNLFNLSMGELIARLVNFAAFAHLARVLGSTEFGRVGLVMTIASYLLLPVLQGYDSVGIRDVARDRGLLGRYAGSILVIRLLSAAATWGTLAAVLPLVQPDRVMRSLILLFALSLFASAVSLKWAFQAVEDVRPVAVAGIAAQLVFAVLAFTVRGPEQVLRIPVYQLLGEASGALLLLGGYSRRFGFPVPVFQWGLWKQLFRESAPLAVSTVLGTLLFNFDVLALAHFQSAEAVGQYTAVYKLVLLFATLLTLFQLSLFPTLARARDGEYDLDLIAGRSLRYLTAIFVPLAFAGLFLAPRLIDLVYGAEYLAGGRALKILLWSLPWMALRAVFRIILVAYNLQELDLSALFAGTVTNVFLDLTLVPRFSTTGAAVSTLTSEFVILFCSYRYVWRRVQPVYLLKHLFRPVIASLLMLMPLWGLAAMPLAVQAAVAGGIYLFVMFLIGGFTREEIAALYRG